jgi:ferredoxin
MAATIAFIILGVILAALLGLWLFGERGRLMRPSTREILRLGGFNFDFLHFYVYGRWTNQYIGTAVRMMRPPKETDPPADGDHYHGKVLPLELAEALITVNEDIPLQDLEQIIPYTMARDLVLAAPPDIVLYECGCRHAREHPCEPTQVCMVIGKPFTDFVLEHNPRTSRRVTQEEALTVLRDEHARGHMHTAYFKDACLDRFYAICNCCKCCCGGYQATVHGGIPMMSSSGYVAEVDAGLCQDCGTCEAACPFDAIHAQGMAVVTWEKCMGCGVCVGQCPEGAITLVPDERKGIPLDVRRLVEGKTPTDSPIRP